MADPLDRTLRNDPSNLFPLLTLYGVSVTAENARHIVASLFADGSPAAMSAAAAIQKGVDRDLYAVALEPDERKRSWLCSRIRPPDSKTSAARSPAIIATAPDDSADR